MPMVDKLAERLKWNETPLSPRAWNALKNKLGEHQFNARHIASLTQAELLSIPNVGKRTLREIEGWLATLGLALDTPVQAPIPFGISTVTLAPGDILVLTMSERISLSEREKMQDMLRPILPRDVRCLVLEPGVSIWKLSPVGGSDLSSLPNVNRPEN